MKTDADYPRAPAAPVRMSLLEERKRNDPCRLPDPVLITRNDGDISRLRAHKWADLPERIMSGKKPGKFVKLRKR